MFPTFQRAIQYREEKIAGLRLGPMSLASAYMLHAFESPYVVPSDEPVTIAQFAMALWICSHPCWPFESVYKAVLRGTPDRVLGRLGRRYDLARYPQDAIDLRDYIQWHCDIPERFFKDAEKQVGNCAPWPMVVAVRIMPFVGEARAWSMTIPMALGYKITADNLDGDHTWKAEDEFVCQPS